MQNKNWTWRTYSNQMLWEIIRHCSGGQFHPANDVKLQNVWCDLNGDISGTSPHTSIGRWKCSWAIVCVDDNVSDNVIFSGHIHLVVQLTGESSSEQHWWKVPLEVRTRKNTAKGVLHYTVRRRSGQFAKTLSKIAPKAAAAIALVFCL